MFWSPQPDPPGSNAINVLKDQNFINEKLEIGIVKQGFTESWNLQSFGSQKKFLKKNSKLFSRPWKILEDNKNENENPYQQIF